MELFGAVLFRLWKRQCFLDVSGREEREKFLRAGQDSKNVFSKTSFLKNDSVYRSLCHSWRCHTKGV